MYENRKNLYNRLAEARGSKVIAYVTGDRQNLETQIAQDAVVRFGDLLDDYEGAKKISLVLYTQGGKTLAAWSLVNLLREFCDELEVIIPSRCQSAGTLVCLGADNIVMTKQATLGPIDPSINTPLNPQIPGAPERVRTPVSVEDIAGYFELSKEEGELKSEESTAKVFMKLADDVHPLALGQVKRARSQIQDLAKKLLNNHTEDTEKIDKIVRILCSEAGSHDYTIHRKEARECLGLNIETPTMELYGLIKEIYIDFREELKLLEPFNPATITGNYQAKRVLVEGQDNGGFHFIKRGVVNHIAAPNGQKIVQDEVTFEGWEHVDG